MKPSNSQGSRGGASSSPGGGGNLPSASKRKRRRTCSRPCVHPDCTISRLIEVLPAESRRPKEPDPAELFAPHLVPRLATGLLRLGTLNLLDDVRVKMGQGGLHALWEMRRVNVLRVMIALDCDAWLLQVLSVVLVQL